MLIKSKCRLSRLCLAVSVLLLPAAAVWAENITWQGDEEQLKKDPVSGKLGSLFPDSASGNRITVTGGNIKESLYGGFAIEDEAEGFASVSDNFVILQDGTVGSAVHGAFGRGESVNLYNNHIEIYGGTAGAGEKNGHVYAAEGAGQLATDIQNNSLAIYGGTLYGQVAGGIGTVSNGSLVIRNNKVTIVDGSFEGNQERVDNPGCVFGGYGSGALNAQGTLDVSGNSVEIRGGTFNAGIPSSNEIYRNSVFGGYARMDANSLGSAEASGNTVLISGGRFEGNDLKARAGSMYGGYARNDSSGNASATGNIVTIEDGTIDGNVAGGYVRATAQGIASASGNTVIIKGGSIDSSVYGGYVGAGGIMRATDNTVILEGDFQLTGMGRGVGNIYGGWGGDFSGSTEGDFFSNNVLYKNSASQVNVVSHFEKIVFGYSGNAGIKSIEFNPDAPRTSLLNSAAPAGMSIDTGEHTVCFDGKIYFEGDITKQGQGTLILSAPNAKYKGTMYVQDGVLRLEDSEGAGSAVNKNPIVVEQGAVLELAFSEDWGGILERDVAGEGGLTLDAGDLVIALGGYDEDWNFANRYTYTGMTTVKTGTLMLTNGLASHKLTLFGGTALNREFNNATHSLRDGELIVNAVNGAAASYIGDLEAQNASLVFLASPEAFTAGEEDTGSPLLRVTGSADISNSAYTIGLSGNTSLTPGMRLHLLQAADGLKADNLHPADKAIRVGATVSYDITDITAQTEISSDDHNLWAGITAPVAPDLPDLPDHGGDTPDKPEPPAGGDDDRPSDGSTPDNGHNNGSGGTVGPGQARQEAGALAQGRLGSLALFVQGAELASGQGMDAALRALQHESDLTAFGVTSGGVSRYSTNSHIDMQSMSLLTGLAWGQSFASEQRLTLGLFFEYDHGSYDTYCSCGQSGSVNGDGAASYLGGGLLARMDFPVAGPGHVYADTVLRAGSMSHDWHSSELRDLAGRGAAWDITSASYGVSAGVGYVRSMSEHFSLDVYGRYFWSRLDSQDASLSTGERLHFSALESNLLNLGCRACFEVNESVSPYIGLSWGHEFDGRAHVTTNGFDIEAQTLAGSSCAGEIGLSVSPCRIPLSVDSVLQGYAGRREGIAGTMSLKLEF